MEKGKLREREKGKEEFGECVYVCVRKREREREKSKFQKHVHVHMLHPADEGHKPETAVQGLHIFLLALRT